MRFCSHRAGKSPVDSVCILVTLKYKGWVMNANTPSHEFRPFPPKKRNWFCRFTVGQNNQEPRLKSWATRSSVCSFACTAHSFACSGLLASLAPYAVLARSLARSLLRLWESFFCMKRARRSHTNTTHCAAPRPTGAQRNLGTNQKYLSLNEFYCYY